MAANREHKDRLFKFIFGNRQNLKWTLSLYNAVNNTSYTNAADIRLTTVEDVVYMSMKNDVSFLIGDTMSFYEQQSTYNPNMPMRFLIYIGMVYSKFIENTEDYNPYSSTLQTAPTPRCVCFYNGTSAKDDKTVLKLTDTFNGESDVEVKVLMININYGHNKELLEACKPLNEYSWLVNKIREYQKTMNSLEDAVDAAIEEMADDFEIKSFLLENKAEVKRMCITEYDEQKTMAAFGREAAHKQAVQGAIRMIKRGKDTLEEIADIMDLPLEEVIALSKEIKAVPV
ncbi:MAG: hypothetical protein IJ062_05320 [Firmicutes bacterium]|nr:hypothetical protein [Bacillota bacterium]